MINKYYYHKANDRKILHKVKKQWVTVSLALLSVIGAGAISTKIAHAQVNAGDSGVKAQVNGELNKGGGISAI